MSLMERGCVFSRQNPKNLVWNILNGEAVSCDMTHTMDITPLSKLSSVSLCVKEMGFAASVGDSNRLGDQAN